MDDSTTLRIGVIGDTHGRLVPEVVERLAGCSYILHAGDVGDPGIIDELEAIAPTTAVRGNQDNKRLRSLPEQVDLELGGVRVVMVHKRKALLKRIASGQIPASRAGRRIDLAVFGHEHAPSVSWIDGTLYLCPGSATAPYEEDEAATYAVVSVDDSGLSVTLRTIAQNEDANGHR